MIREATHNATRFLSKRGNAEGSSAWTELQHVMDVGRKWGETN
jgi:hypothetical protein